MIIYTDGASRGNPGSAAAAFVLADEQGNQIYARASYIPNATNNIAEYTALVDALTEARTRQAKTLRIYSDSELMVRQVTGRYRVKSTNIQPLHARCVKLLADMDDWQIEHIRREKNTVADSLANMAIDKKADIEESSDQAQPQTRPTRLAVLISGGGTTMMNILAQIKSGRLNAKISLVISSLSKAAGVQKAIAAGLDVKIIRKKDYQGTEEFSQRIRQELLAAEVDLVVQAGWLCFWQIPPEFESRVMNIHPALLPSFGGQGMWGHHVHEAVLKAGCKISGCTVHFCTNEYDKGPIIVQRTCPAKDTDDPDTLAARVFEQECIAYPEAIRLFGQDKLTVQGTIVKIKENCRLNE